MKRSDVLRLIVAGLLSLILLVGMTACGSDSGGGSGDADPTEIIEDAGDTGDDTGEDDALSGQEAPDFEVELTDGTTMSLSDAEGKVVLLNFWATWCGPCVGEMPALQKLYDDYNTTEVQILAVDCGETKREVDSFVKENGYTFPIAYDEEGTLSTELYPTDGIPYTVIIDRKGNIVTTFLGADESDIQYEKYKKVISETLGE